MENLLEKAIAGMEKGGFEVVQLKTGAEACEYLTGHIPADKSVGVGGSMSVKESGAIEALRDKGCTVHTHWGAPPEKGPEIRRNARLADVYLCSANAVTKTGQMVLVDGTGNRVGAVCDGPEQVYFVVSQNKVVDGGFTTAIARIKQFACPKNALRLGLKTSCALNGTCSDDCPDSMCRVSIVLDRVPRGRKMTVLLVEETLGY